MCENGFRRGRRRISSGEKTYFVGWKNGSLLFLAGAVNIFGGSREYF